MSDIIIGPIKTSPLQVEVIITKRGGIEGGERGRDGGREEGG